MLRNLFRQRPNERQGDALYALAVEQARGAQAAIAHELAPSSVSAANTFNVFFMLTFQLLF